MCVVFLVKSYKAGFVTSDSNIKPDQTLNELVAKIEQTGHSTVAVTENGESDGKLVGIITERDFRLSHVDGNSKVSEYMTPLKDLVKAMLNYGGLSQEYFGIDAENPAEGYEYTTELDGVTLDTIKGLSVNKASAKIDGLNYTGSWLELRSTLVLYHSFEVTGNIADYTFKCGDVELTPIWMGGNSYAVAVTEVYAQNIATEDTLTVTDGDATYTLTYNAMNYIKLAYNDATLNDLVSALYLYYAEAYDYFN